MDVLGRSVECGAELLGRRRTSVLREGAVDSESDVLVVHRVDRSAFCFFHSDAATRIRRDTMCLMRSVATDSWLSAESGDLTGDENTAAWAARVRTGIAAVPAGTSTQAEAQAQMMQAFQEAQQKRILRSVFTLPRIMWIVIDLGVLVFASLSMFATPFSHVGVSVPGPPSGVRRRRSAHRIGNLRRGGCGKAVDNEPAP